MRNDVDSQSIGLKTEREHCEGVSPPKRVNLSRSGFEI